MTETITAATQPAYRDTTDRTAAPQLVDISLPAVWAARAAAEPAPADANRDWDSIPGYF